MYRFLPIKITGYVPLLCLLIVATLALYVPSLQHGFISIDDGTLVLQSRFVQEPLSFSSLQRIFTSYDPELYIPLTFLSFKTDVAIAGLNPRFFHFHNILLHTLNVLLVFWLLLQLQAGRVAAFLGAVFFAVHPINAEAVLWISARKDLLSAFFGLLFCNCFLRWNSVSLKRWYVLALCAFFLGLLAKVTILLLPLFFLFFPQRQSRTVKRRLFAFGPFVFLSIIFAIIAVVGKSGTFTVATPLAYYPLLAAKAIVLTLGKVLIPTHFSLLYPQMTPVTVASSEFLIPLIMVALISIVIFVTRRKFPILWQGAVFFLLAFAPSFLTFTKNGELFFTSDRYVYSAFLGIAWIIGVIVMWVYHVLEVKHRALRVTWQLLIAGVLMSLCILTAVRIDDWKTDESLMRNIISVVPGHALAYNNLGVNLVKEKKSAEAEEQFRLAMKLSPHFMLPRMNLASLLMKQGRTEEALDLYYAAIQAIDRTKPIRSDDLTAFYFLAEILDSRGDSAGALALYEEAAKLGLHSAEAQYNLAVTLQKYGKIPEAEVAYSRVITLDPRFIDAHFNLAEILASRGNLEEALVHLDAVVELQPENEAARNHQANIRHILGK